MYLKKMKEAVEKDDETVIVLMAESYVRGFKVLDNVASIYDDATRINKRTMKIKGHIVKLMTYYDDRSRVLHGKIIHV